MCYPKSAAGVKVDLSSMSSRITFFTIANLGLGGVGGGGSPIVGGSQLLSTNQLNQRRKGEENLKKFCKVLHLCNKMHRILFQFIYKK